MLRLRVLVVLAVTAALAMAADQRPTAAQGSAAQAPAAPASGAPAPAPPAPQQPGADPSPQQPGSDQTPPQPIFRTGINFVRVDVIATAKGEPVTNLTQADFEVREDGKPQTIEQFRLVKVDGDVRPGGPPPRQIRNRDDETAEAARDDVRVIVIFLDDYHTRALSAMSVKQPLIDFIQT